MATKAVSPKDKREQELDKLQEAVEAEFKKGTVQTPGQVQAWFKTEKKKSLDYNTARSVQRRLVKIYAGNKVDQPVPVAPPAPEAPVAAPVQQYAPNPEKQAMAGQRRTSVSHGA